jgi:electron transfer flavoprotein alpha subunit
MTMGRIVVLLHTESDDTLGRPALEALTAARSLAADLTSEFAVALVGGSVQEAAGLAAGAGASAIYAVEGADFCHARYSSDAAALDALCRRAGADLVVAPGTSRWNRVLPGIACRLGGRIDTHVCDINVDGGAPVVTRWYYRQRMKARIGRAQRPWFIVCDPGSFVAYEGEAKEALIEPVSTPTPETGFRTEVIGFQKPAEGGQTIRPDADVLFVAGAGWTKSQPDGNVKVGDAEALILSFLKSTRASLGGSKSMVDLSSEGQETLSFMTHLNQIGQTGATPRHPKGLSTCCHGEEPHVVGWRFVNERRAVNLDPNCGWAQGKADVLYVGDAFEIISKVNELLAAD